MMPWEHEAQAAVRAANAVFDPSALAWLDPAGATAQADPSDAMERLFRGLIGGEVPADRAIERPAPSAPTSASARPTRPPAGAPTARSASRFLSAANEVAGSPVGSPGESIDWFRTAAAPIPLQATTPAAMPAAAAEPSRVAAVPLLAAGSRLISGAVGPEPAAESDRPAARRRQSPPAAAASAMPRASGIEPAPSQPLGRIVDAPRPPNAQAAAPARPGLRQPTTRAELDTLFRMVVADSRGEAAAARPAASQPASAASPETVGPPPMSHPSPPLHVVRDVAPPLPEARRPTFSTTTVRPAPPVAPAEQDPVAAAQLVANPTRDTFPAFPLAAEPADEEALIDRLLDRLEERMREQAIRQLGFTGGLT